MFKSKEHVRVCLLYEFKLGHRVAGATRNICHAIGPDAIEKNNIISMV